MANWKLDEVMEMLNKIMERLDKYEKNYLKKTMILLLVFVLQVKRTKWNIKNSWNYLLF